MLETVIIISLICIGVHMLTAKGMIFHKFAKALQYTMQDSKFSWVLEPLFACPPCMASVWTLISWVYMDYSFDLIPVMLAVCGANSIGLSLIQNIIDDD